MKLAYTIGIFFYATLAKIVALFNKKAKQRENGLKKNAKILEEISQRTQKKIWIHCASLGEFEQGRPVLEAIKAQFPDREIILTFFSPSGYQVRKNYNLADYILYLPYDIKKNAKQFIEKTKPEIAIFVKYEFWYWFLHFLKQNKIPTYLISGIFRKNQIFFKPYGSFFREILTSFTYFFVQNDTSQTLLAKIGFSNTNISGDTRFDRVAQIVKNHKKIEIVNQFKDKKRLIIAGSTWPEDEKLLVKIINESTENVKYIIVPHEIHKNHINQLNQAVKKKHICFSVAQQEKIKEYDVLIVDSVGILSSLYAYADIAYIGGGFGAGIHNTLEAATFGLPLIFGPNYHKFQEANDLIENKAAFSIKNYEELSSIVLFLLNHNDLHQVGNIAKNYVLNNLGATEKILRKLNLS